jgi:hypothetical protein
MKKLLITLVTLLLTVVAVQSQTISIYKCYSVAFIFNDNSTPKTDKVSFYIEVNSSTQTVVFKDGENTKFFLTQFIGKQTDVDSDGDIYVQREFKAVDQDGVKCTFIIAVYSYLLPNVTMFMVDYPGAGSIAWGTNQINN